jgi:hypothetical protein
MPSPVLAGRTKRQTPRANDRILEPIAASPYRTPAQVAAWFTSALGHRVSARLIQAECKKGRMKCLVIGQRYLIHEADAAEYLRRAGGTVVLPEPTAAGQKVR